MYTSRAEVVKGSTEQKLRTSEISGRVQIKSLASPHAHGSSDPLSTLELASLTDEHVRATVEAVASSDLVRAAWDEGRDLSVHGWVYHVATAKLRDLDCGFKGRESPLFLRLLSLSLALECGLTERSLCR